MSPVLQRLLHNLNLHSLLWGLVQAGAWLCYPLRWLSIYNKEWDITVIQSILSTSTSELFRKALVDIWIDLYLIKFQFLAILCVFCLPFTWRNLHHRCTILSISIQFKTHRPRAYLLPHWKLLSLVDFCKRFRKSISQINIGQVSPSASLCFYLSFTVNQ